MLAITKAFRVTFKRYGFIACKNTAINIIGDGCCGGVWQFPQHNSSELSLLFGLQIFFKNKYCH